MSETRPEPSRSTIVKWLRVNLAMTMAILSVVNGGLGLVIGGTWRVSKYDSRFVALEDKVDKLEKHEAKRTEQDDQDAKAAQAEVHERDERRIRLARDLGDINGQLGGLRVQVSGLLESGSKNEDTRKSVAVIETKIQMLAEGLRDTYGALSKVTSKR